MKTPQIRSLASILGALFLSAVSAIAVPAINDPTEDQPLEPKDEGKSVTMTVTASGDGGTLQFQWYKVDAMGSDLPLSNGNGYSGVLTSSLKISPLKGFHQGDYYVKVTEVGEGDVDSPIFNLIVLVKPKIATQPALPSTPPHEGDGVSFSVTLKSDSTLDGIGYQWQKNNVDIDAGDNPSAITDTFIIPAEEEGNPDVPGVQGSDAGTYRVKITSPLFPINKPLYSKAIKLAVTSSPFIVKQPAADTAGTLYIAAKGSGKLSVVAGGTPKLAYQWEKVNGTGPTDDDSILKATATSLTVKAGENNEGEGLYRVKVTNNFTQPLGVNPPAYSAYAEVIVLNKLAVGTITPSAAPEVNGEFLAGLNPLTLSVTPSTDDTGTLEFQWQKDGKDITDVPGEVTGTNTRDLTFSPLSWLHRGTYRCIIMNKVSKVTSKTYVLKVNSPPILITPPPALIVAPLGGTADFNVVAGGSVPLKYQWFKVGSVEAVSKEGTSGKFKISGKLLTEASEGSYFCRITNKDINGQTRTLDTNSVTLRVDVPVKISASGIKANGLPAKSVQVTTGDPLDLSISTSEGDGPITFQWQRNGKDLEDGSGFNGSRTVLESPANLRADVVLSITPLSENSEGTYRCVITNADGKVKVTSGTCKVKALITPSIVEQPEDVTVMQDLNATFRVKAAGTGPLKYQWQFRKVGDPTFVNLDKKTAATLTLAKVQPDSAGPPAVVGNNGEYRCVVSNSTGIDAISQVAELTVIPIPAPTITNITPRKAQAGDKVRVTGTGMNFVTEAYFGTVKVTPVKESPSTVLLTVPASALLSPTSVSLVTKGGRAETSSPNTFQRVTIPVNDRNNPKILVGTTFPKVNSETTGGLAPDTLALPTDGSLGEAVYTWVLPKAGQHQFVFSAVFAAYINFKSTLFNQTFEISAINNRFIGFIPVDNLPITITIYGIGPNFGVFQIVGNYEGPLPTQDTPGPDPEVTSTARGTWAIEGDTGSSSVTTSGDDDQAVTFTGSSSNGSQPTVLWRDTSDVQANSDSVIHTEWTMSIDRAGTGTDGYFGWQVSGSDGSALGQLQFSVADGRIYLAQPDGTRTEVDPDLFPDSSHRFEITTDLGEGTWQARMDGVALGELLPLPTGAGFGDISVIWYPGASTGTPPTMTFDEVTISVDPKPATKVSR